MPRNIHTILPLVLTLGIATAGAAQTSPPITLPYLLGYAIVAFNVVLVLAWVVLKLNKGPRNDGPDDSDSHHDDTTQ